MDYLMDRRVGIIQYPCPETTAMGLMRNPQGRQQYDNIFFRNHCKELLQTPFLMVEEFLKNGYRLVAYLGLKNSPTCGINWGRHKVNRYNTESPMPVDLPDPEDPVLMGIMAELPIQEPPESALKTEFWFRLKGLVEPRNPRYQAMEEGDPTT